MIKKRKIKFKPCLSPNAYVNLIDEKFIALITNINMIGEYDGCWIDIDSSHHVCYDCAMFKTYTNKKVLLGVPHTTNIISIREVEQNPPLKGL